MIGSLFFEHPLAKSLFDCVFFLSLELLLLAVLARLAADVPAYARASELAHGFVGGWRL